MASFILMQFDKYYKENFILKLTLKQQKRMYEKHLEKVQDPVIITSASQLHFTNEASRNKIASTPEEFWERTAFIITENGESLNEEIKARFDSGNIAPPVQKQYFMYDTASDIIAYNRIFSTTLIESSVITGEKVVSLTFHDITEDLIKEENRVEKKYKNMLLFSLSHELRTPLNIFQLFLGEAKKLVKTQEDQEMRKDAKGAWRYLLNKINDILTYAQMLANEFVLHKSGFSLQRFVKRLQKMTYRLLGRKRNSIQLKFLISPEVRDEFVGDKERLEQVLVNFLSNAAKYTTVGEISLTIRYSQNPSYTQGSSTALVFKVSDTGCGMSPERVTALFSLRDRDSSDHKKAKKSKGLSGLGLTVSKMLCNRMSSNIKVKSQLGKGSRFSFGLPVTDPYTGDSAVPEERTEVNTSTFYSFRSKQVTARQGKIEDKDMHKIKVVVVDDNEFNRSVVAKMVNKMGFDTIEAENGKEGLEKVLEIQENKEVEQIIVFMDLDMPVMDGIEATVEIRKVQKDPQPYIVALTAFSSEEERDKCFEFGMNSFITKPLRKEELLDLFFRLKLFYQFLAVY
eukprot:TRINITY_DN1110_c0_g1_i2.p1 TRINITY_DN1110_c0_g1~~TRINITY_DN1110_c0_g1_i2.p1  ORF type:complete len:570 (-),score=72.14 TRINITY_DN1110_c0_g1_i2:79-1788(-)